MNPKTESRKNSKPFPDKIRNPEIFKNFFGLGTQNTKNFGTIFKIGTTRNLKSLEIFLEPVPEAEKT